MAKSTIAATVAALVSVTYAAQCQNLTIPVNITARNGVFNLANPTNNIESTNFALMMARQGHNYTNEILEGVRTASHWCKLRLTLVIVQYRWRLIRDSCNLLPARLWIIKGSSDPDPWNWFR